MEHLPKIWINVSTSAKWTRPAVGIVRVERELAANLQALIGKDRCGLCVWEEDRFVEWIPPSTSINYEVTAAIDLILPRATSFDLARPFLQRAFERFSNKGAQRGSSSQLLAVDLPTAGSAEHRLRPGDFLISVGLDWDMPYSSRLHEITQRQGLRIITCCYDLIPVLYPQYCVGDVALRFKEYFLDLAWGSEAVLCISKNTKSDYLRLCKTLGAPPQKTAVIPLGDNIPSKAGVIGDQVRSIVASPFILFVSTIERRKNHEVLYRAYHILARRGLGDKLPKLLFVGMQGWGVGDLMKDIEIDPLTQGKIVQLHHVNDAELAYLYEQAAFCVYPSMYEGWGLPVGEALAAGKAVIASAEGSLPEVGGDLLRYASPWDPTEWADAIYQYTSQPELVHSIEVKIKENYAPRQWKDTAAAVIHLIEHDLPPQPLSPKVFFPGYDCSTLVGLHQGSILRSTGSAGILMFGPHIGLRAGCYRVEFGVFLHSEHQGSIEFVIASDGGSRAHAKASMEPGSAGARSVELSFTTVEDIIDLEFQCHIGANSNLEVHRVNVYSS